MNPLVVQAILSPPCTAHETHLVHFGLILELWVFGLYRLELDGDLFARDDVDPEVDVAWLGEKGMVVFVSWGLRCRSIREWTQQKTHQKTRCRLWYEVGRFLG